MLKKLKDITSKILDLLIIRIVLLVGAVYVLWMIMGAWGIVAAFSNYFLNNQIVTAVVIGLILYYLQKYIDTEYKRYNSIVYLDRLFLENYNILLGNRDLINDYYDKSDLAIWNILLGKLALIDKDKLCLSNT